MPKPPAAVSGNLSWVLAASRLAGLDVDALLAAADLEPDVILDPEAPVPFDSLVTLRRLAETRSADPAFALHAGERLPVGTLGIVDYVCVTGPTVEQAMLNLCRYFRLVAHAGLRLTFAREHGLGRVDAEMHEPLPAELRWLERQSTEFTFAAIMSRSRAATGLPVRPARVTFRHDRPSYASEVERVFAAPIEFGSATNSLWLDSATLALEPKQADTRLHHLLCGHADTAIGKLPPMQSVAAQVLSVLKEQLRGGNPAVAHVAKRLAMSQRTLQRRLAEEGASFADLRDRLRCELAQAYLHDPGISVADVSYLLGFSQPSAFHRAFKRWLGIPPQAFRSDAMAHSTSSRSSR